MGRISERIMKRYYNYKKKYGETQTELVHVYLKMGKDYDEIQKLLKCPRASIRGRASELKNR